MAAGEKVNRISTRSRTERIVLIALFSALAFVVNLAESAFPLPFPGMRLGLANIFSFTALLLFGPASAVLVSVLRVAMAFIISGNPFALACSAGGLLCSLSAAILLYQKFGRLFSVEAISIAAAVAFNAGQISVVVLLTGEPALFWYLPLLTVAASLTGLAVGFLACTLAARLKKTLIYRSGPKG